MTLATKEGEGPTIRVRITKAEMRLLFVIYPVMTQRGGYP